MRLEIEENRFLKAWPRSFDIILLVTVETGVWKIKSRRNKKDANTRHTIKLSKSMKGLMQKILNGNSKEKDLFLVTCRNPSSITRSL